METVNVPLEAAVGRSFDQRTEKTGTINEPEGGEYRFHVYFSLFLTKIVPLMRPIANDFPFGAQEPQRTKDMCGISKKKKK